MSAIDFVEDNHLQWPCTNQEYHDDMSRDSHSSLHLFMDSVEQYYARRIARYVPPSIPDDALIFGSLFHAYVLEPNVLEDEYITQEKYDRRTKAGKAQHIEFSHAAAGKKIVSEEQMQLASDMASSMLRNHVALEVLSADGLPECALRWTDRMTSCPMKMRVDKLLGDGTIVDLKTTQNISPAAWAKTVHNFGYHRQAALYLDGLEALGISKGMPFLFLACSKTPPHECVCYELDYNAIQLGRAENLAAMAELSDRRKRDDWSGRWSGRVNKISLPAYAFSRS